MLLSSYKILGAHICHKEYNPPGAYIVQAEKTRSIKILYGLKDDHYVIVGLLTFWSLDLFTCPIYSFSSIVFSIVATEKAL